MSGLFPILALALIAAGIGVWLWWSWWSNRPLAAGDRDLENIS